jgi:hypothetical protein
MPGDDATLACFDQHGDGIALVKISERQNNVMRSRIMATYGMAGRALLRGNRFTSGKELTIGRCDWWAQYNSKQTCKNGYNATS